MSLLSDALTPRLSEKIISYMDENPESTRALMKDADNAFVERCASTRATSEPTPSFFDNVSESWTPVSVVAFDLDDDYLYMVVTDNCSGRSGSWGQFHCIAKDGKICAPCFGVSKETMAEIKADSYDSMMLSKSRKRKAMAGISERYESFIDDANALMGAAIPAKSKDAHAFLERCNRRDIKLNLNWANHILAADGFAKIQNATNCFFEAVDAQTFASAADVLAIRMGGGMSSHLELLKDGGSVYSFLRSRMGEWVSSITESVSAMIESEQIRDQLGDEWGSW